METGGALRWGSRGSFDVIMDVRVAAVSAT
jgi:hypothetical protein